MTQAKKLKQTIRARARKTGESYAVARTQVLAKLLKQRQSSTAQAADIARAAPARGTVSEDKCIEKTGHGFDHWFFVLDRFGATKKGHTAAARHLREDHEVSAWYSQSITVAYERARGQRELHQTCAGTYQVSASRVLPASLKQTVEAFTHEGNRESWLVEADDELAEALVAALAMKQWRRREDVATFSFKGPEGKVGLRVTTRPDGRATLSAQAQGLAERASVDIARDRLRRTLDALRKDLADDSS